jgi:Zn-dependent protease/CBS domain-containing protein
MYTQGIKIGAVAGIDITIDVSWIVIALLVWWNISQVVLPSLQPELPGIAAGLWGLGGTFLFFSSLLLHEMAHALVARSAGLPVKSVSLFLFGGVAHIEKEPETAVVEFKMAFAGPLTSLILAGFFWAASNYLVIVSPLPSLFAWLAFINLMLALFNLLPGFPLDGGRIFRSLWWGFTGNLSQATMLATFIGQVVGYGFLGIGVLMSVGVWFPVLGSGLINGFWLGFIGLFLTRAAMDAYSTKRLSQALAEVPAKEVMRTDVPTIPAHTTIASLMQTHGEKAHETVYPVLESQSLIGTITIDDTRELPRNMWNKNTVKDMMTPTNQLEILQPDSAVDQALPVLTQRQQEEIPVVSGKTLLGMVSLEDVFLWHQGLAIKD